MFMDIEYKKKNIKENTPPDNLLLIKISPMLSFVVVGSFTISGLHQDLKLFAGYLVRYDI